MVTGDNIRTAIAISKAIGILTKEEAEIAKKAAIDKEKVDIKVKILDAQIKIKEAEEKKN
jgi:magnesium-transporting ATPase (P-type)